MSIDIGKTKSLGSIDFTDAERQTIEDLCLRIGRGDENGNIGSGHLSTTAAKAICERDLLACTATTHVIRALLRLKTPLGVSDQHSAYLWGVHDTLAEAISRLAGNRVEGGEGS